MNIGRLCNIIISSYTLAIPAINYPLIKTVFPNTKN